MKYDTSLTPIETLYYDFIGTDEYADLDSSEPICISEEELEAIESCLPKDIANRVSDATLNLACARECNGFVLGFEYAMKILAQCGIALSDVRRASS